MVETEGKGEKIMKTATLRRQTGLGNTADVQTAARNKLRRVKKAERKRVVHQNPSPEPINPKSVHPKSMGHPSPRPGRGRKNQLKRQIILSGLVAPSSGTLGQIPRRQYPAMRSGGC